MSYQVRLMRQQDISQVIEIDREAFPTDWPLPDFRYELRNRIAHYLVVCEGKTMEKSEADPPPEEESTGLTTRVRRLFSHHPSSNETPTTDFIVGFVGFWVVADEAHITNIAVRISHRNQGLGELLLISLIDLAVKLNARLMTLEVRVSNTTAQSLYAKYGFVKVGLRRGYYTDNKEDALLMTIESLTAAPFQEQLNQLKQAHYKRWGASYPVAQ